MEIFEKPVWAPERKLDAIPKIVKAEKTKNPPESKLPLEQKPSSEKNKKNNILDKELKEKLH